MNPEHGILRLPGKTRFPTPCLDGNMLYLHHYFHTSHSELMRAIRCGAQQLAAADPAG